MCPAQAWPEAEEALRAELTLIGLEVEVVQSNATTEAEQRAELVQVAREKKAVASLRIQRVEGSSDGVDLWVADRITSKTTTRRLSLENTSTSDAVTIIAVRAVETLRASLLELRMVDRSKLETEPSEEIDEIVGSTALEEPVRGGFLGIGVGAAIIGSPGGVGPRGGFDLMLSWLPLPPLDLEINAQLSPLGARVATENGKSTFDYGLFRGWAYWQILPDGWVHPFVGIGGGVLVAWAEGSTAGEGLSSEDLTWCGYLGAAARIGFDITDHFQISAGAKVGALVPEIQIRRNEHELARFGRPIIEGELGVRLLFP